MAATAVAAAVSMSSAPAIADPQLPDSASEAAKELRELSHKAEQLTEEYKAAKDAHEARRADLERATAEAARAAQVAEQARAAEEKFRVQVDQLTGASYEGARMNQLSALLVSKSPSEFLDRAAALEMLAKDNREAVQALASATEQAEAAERRAQEARARAAKAEADAARLEQEIAAKKDDMEAQIERVREHMETLTQEERESLVTDGETDYQFEGGAGAAAAAVQAALSKQGSPYEWGATGPSQFDCSGLIYWAYKQAGVSVPRSSKTQSRTGESISASELKPGDLIFYYSPVSHVSMYVGNGKAVHAPTEGDVVKVDDYDDIAPVNGMRRIVG